MCLVELNDMGVEPDRGGVSPGPCSIVVEPGDIPIAGSNECSRGFPMAMSVAHQRMVGVEQGTEQGAYVGKYWSCAKHHRYLRGECSASQCQVRDH